MKPTLLVMAAGMGSRYGGVKQIEAVGQHDETLLDFAVYDAFKSGFGKVVFVIRKDIEKDFNERLFKRLEKHGQAEYVFQQLDTLLTTEQIALSKNRKKPWGTVHAVLAAKDRLHEPFAIINADDYYGRSAYTTMAGHLKAIANDSSSHAMVSYLLKNTLSRSGSVSRGVCKIENGLLKSIHENKRISYEQRNGREVIISLDEQGEEHLLTGDEAVSMNLFGFAPSALDFFQQYFDDFLVEHLQTEKEESLLPEAAALLINLAKGTLHAYSSEEQWFGMTYPADRDIVRAEIAKKIAEGYYPAELWA